MDLTSSLASILAPLEHRYPNPVALPYWFLWEVFCWGYARRVACAAPDHSGNSGPESDHAFRPSVCVPVHSEPVAAPRPQNPGGIGTGATAVARAARRAGNRKWIMQ